MKLSLSYHEVIQETLMECLIFRLFRNLAQTALLQTLK